MRAQRAPKSKCMAQSSLWEQVKNPWSLATVGSFMSAKYRQEKSALAESALTVYLCKRMSHAQLKKAMELALNHPKREWAFLIRFSLAWACGAARRSSDMLNLLFAGMCVHDFRQTTPDEPLVSRVSTSARGIRPL